MTLGRCSRLAAWLLAALLVSATVAFSQSSQQPASFPQQSQGSFTLQVNTDLVLTTVAVRDKKTGAIVRGLTQSDFTVLENGKPQRISSFDFQSVDQAQPLNEATIAGAAGAAQGKSGSLFGSTTGSSNALRDHRLLVLFFDLTSMQPEDLERAVESARNYINRQMQPADLVALVSLSSSLSLDQDFTSNKQLLLAAVGRYNGTQAAGFAPGATSTTNTVEDSSSYTPDESEYNDINTDRELFAIASIAQSLSRVAQKKSLLYFSGGLTRDGIENQASLRAATNAAVKADLSIYSVDARGLEAFSPVGDASTGSLRGTGAFNGAATQNNFDANFNSQETLATLSSDTGGKSFFDSNDFAPAFQRVQQDTSAYYLIGFVSSSPVRDGRFRKLTIKVNRSDLRLEYRPGYYAPADYQHANKEDRERQLEDQLASELPATDVEVFLQAFYFRADAGSGNSAAPTRFTVPVSLIIPGSQIPFTKGSRLTGGDRDKATLDILGQVKDAAGHDAADVRQTVKLAVDASQQVSRKNVQYSTSFNLPTGRYHLKFVVRENQTGRMGSFEADIQLPDLRKLPVRLSSVVLASQRTPAPKKDDNPLTNGGLTWVPNVAHVFRTDQHLYMLYEVYDPARSKAAVTGAETTGESSPPVKGKPAPAQSSSRLLTSIEFLQGTTKVFETPLVEADTVNVPTRGAVSFAFDIPLDQLKPGLYICQVNVIDDAGGAFSFPRQAVLIRSAPAAADSVKP